MRASFPLLGLCAVLAACGPSQTPEQRAQSRETKAATQAAREQAQEIVVGGNTYRVALLQERGYSLVERIKGSGPYGVADVEAAAGRASGCKAAFQPGVLAMLTGYESTTLDLGHMQKVSRDFKGWRVDLQC